jgi:hypothetical protein
MTAALRGGKTVKLVTWQPLWFYWPAYLAFARSLKSPKFENLELEFSLEEKTDERIRRAYYGLVNQSHQALAICEPSEFTLPRDPAEEAISSEQVVRRVPIVWRLPHWLYWCGDDSEIETISALPENTTSGDYVRRVVQALPRFKGRVRRFHDIDGSLAQDRESLARLVQSPNGHCVASYTPWHAIEGLPEASLHCLALPGPKKEVTSLLYVGDEGDLMPHFADTFCGELKLILLEMADTHGDRGLMEEFIERNVADVDRLLDRAGLVASTGWTPEFLPAALAEYVVMGCYFPYAPIDAAMSAEIRRHVERHLKAMSVSVLNKVQADIRSFLGVNIHWRDLSFDQRISVWTRIKQINKKSLFTMWTHPTREEESPAQRLLYGDPVPVGEHQGHVALGRLVSELPPSCPFKGRAETLAASATEGEFRSCLRQARVEGETGARPIASVETDSCALCVLSGAPHALARSAALRLRRYCADRGRQLEVGHKVGEMGDKTYSGDCPVTAWDVDDMLAVFADELRGPMPGAGPPCRTILYNGYDHRNGRGDVLFAILWRGTVEPRVSGVNGGATARLGEMAVKGKAAGRPLSWIGFWHRKGDIVRIGGSAQGESAWLFQAVRAEFERGDYNFAYVALFSPGTRERDE